MEIKKYIPEITAVGLAETAATVAAIKSASEGKPYTANELFLIYSIFTVFAGIPAVGVIQILKDSHLLDKRTKK